VFPVELVVKDTTDSSNTASYLDLERDIDGTLTARLCDKRDDFGFPIVSCPFLDGGVPSSPAYGVCASRLVQCRYFLHRSVLLAGRLLSQGFMETGLGSMLGVFWSLPSFDTPLSCFGGLRD